MSRPTRDSAAARALIARVESRVTGRLSVVNDERDVSIYLLQGDLIAATTEEDDRITIRMLSKAGVIDDGEAERLEQKLDAGDDIFSELLAHEATDHLLFERFRQNVADYLSSGMAPRFFEQRTVMVPNIQMGHRTLALIDDVCAQCDGIRTVELDQHVVRGRTAVDPDTTAGRVAAAVAAGTRRVADLLEQLPIETGRLRWVVTQLLQTGALDRPGAPSPSAEVEVDLTSEEVVVDEDDTLSNEGLTEEPTGPQTRLVTPPGRAAPPAPPPDPNRSASAPTELDLERRLAARPAPSRTPTVVARAIEVRGPPVTRTPTASRTPPPPTPVAERYSKALFGARPPEPKPDARTPEPQPRATERPTERPTERATPPEKPAARPAPPDPRPSPDRALRTSEETVELSGLLAERIAASRAAEKANRGRPAARPEPSEPITERPTDRERPPTPVPSPAPDDFDAVTPRPVRGRDTARTPLPPVDRSRARAAEEDDDDEDVDDAFTEQVDRRIERGSPRSLSDWLNRTEAVGEEELGFFSDHDHERGGDADGQFRTDDHNLETIEVTSISQEETSTEIEVEEAPVAKYGAPPLSHVDAMAKIEVTNEVLAVIAEAFDEVEGVGRGRAVMQLLVDGVAGAFATVLHDLKVPDTGALPAEQLLRNLHQRPVTEHRQLLNSTLVDLIERAMSAAADELPDEAVDRALEATTGYRQRLGL